MENNSLMQIFEKTENIVTRSIAGELFLVPIAGNLANMQRIFALTAVAEFIWERLDGRMSLKDIRSAVLAGFEATEEQADADIAEFIRELLKEGLVKEVVNRQ